MTHFKAALMYISLRKKLNYYPSSIITHKNLSTMPFITCNTCYSFSCLFLGTASRRPNEKHRSPLLVQADQSIRTSTAMVHAGMSDFYYFGMVNRTDHHSPANCSLTFLIFGCLLSKNSQTHFFINFTPGIKCFYEHKVSHKF